MIVALTGSDRSLDRRVERTAVAATGCSSGLRPIGDILPLVLAQYALETSATCFRRGSFANLEIDGSHAQGSLPQVAWAE